MGFFDIYYDEIIMSNLLDFRKRRTILSLHPRSGWAQDAPSKGAGISNIDTMNFEVMVVSN